MPAALPLHSSSRRALAEDVPSFLILLACAVALRMAFFGDPLIHVDEMFYNLVGERMLAGSVPFVDIWDRKPVGLFLVYALAAAPGLGVIGYQLLATLCAALTALGIERIARTIASGNNARLAGIAYLFGLSVFRCYGGQSPVFYNLLMVIAAGIALRALTRYGERRLLVPGCAIMLLVGAALQIKYTVVFEGMALGMALLWEQWRCSGKSVATVLHGMAWIACALVPTALVFGWYAAQGDIQAFVFANFISIFQRDTGTPFSLDRASDLLTDIALTAPFWGGLIYFHLHRHHPRLAPERNAAERTPGALPWLSRWALAALVGFLAMGVYYDHYTAALLPPLAILVAPVLDAGVGRRLPGRLIFVFLAVAACAISVANRANFGDAKDLAEASALIRPELHGRCLYVFEGNAALYSGTDACLVSRYAFPQHISGATDSVALEESAGAALTQALAKRPGVIVTGVRPVSPRPNWAVRPLLERTLARDYEAFGQTRLGKLKLRLYRLKNTTR